MARECQYYTLHQHDPHTAEIFVDAMNAIVYDEKLLFKSYYAERFITYLDAYNHILNEALQTNDFPAIVGARASIATLRFKNIRDAYLGIWDAPSDEALRNIERMYKDALADLALSPEVQFRQTAAQIAQFRGVEDVSDEDVLWLLHTYTAAYPVDVHVDRATPPDEDLDRQIQIALGKWHGYSIRIDLYPAVLQLLQQYTTARFAQDTQTPTAITALTRCARYLITNKSLALPEFIDAAVFTAEESPQSPLQQALIWGYRYNLTLHHKKKLPESKLDERELETRVDQALKELSSSFQ